MATIDANKPYEYTKEDVGSFSGGTWTSVLGDVPHPISYKQSDPTNVNSPMDIVNDLSAITLGGFSGLNN